jgi:hypothetical protein
MHSRLRGHLSILLGLWLQVPCMSVAPAGPQGCVAMWTERLAAPSLGSNSSELLDNRVQHCLCGFCQGGSRMHYA